MVKIDAVTAICREILQKEEFGVASERLEQGEEVAVALEHCAEGAGCALVVAPNALERQVRSVPDGWMGAARAVDRHLPADAICREDEERSERREGAPVHVNSGAAGNTVRKLPGAVDEVIARQHERPPHGLVPQPIRRRLRDGQPERRAVRKWLAPEEAVVLGQRPAESVCVSPARLIPERIVHIDQTLGPHSMSPQSWAKSSA